MFVRLNIPEQKMRNRSTEQRIDISRNIYKELLTKFRLDGYRPLTEAAQERLFQVVYEIVTVNNRCHAADIRRMIFDYVRKYCWKTCLRLAKILNRLKFQHTRTRLVVSSIKQHLRDLKHPRPVIQNQAKLFKTIYKFVWKNRDIDAEDLCDIARDATNTMVMENIQDVLASNKTVESFFA